jgi:hypothetical protein
MEAGVVHFTRIIQKDGNFGVSFNAGNGVDNNSSGHFQGSLM